MYNIFILITHFLYFIITKYTKKKLKNNINTNKLQIPVFLIKKKFSIFVSRNCIILVHFFKL